MEAGEVLDKTASVGRDASLWFLQAALMTSRCEAFCGPCAYPSSVPRWPRIGWHTGTSPGWSPEVAQSGIRKTWMAAGLLGMPA
ncbi:hypothetical protein BHE74_00015401 [Ensete ventricosum]|nr:hypothetical protein GW17_00037861 [Ensete ventricosum]RWW76512.1 hypothetical protein BHE74_00015401 [Ensete ventricosum]